MCAAELAMRNIRSKKIKGFASVWQIECEKCRGYTSVHTSKCHQQYNSDSKKKWAYNINTKAAVGKYQFGLHVSANPHSHGLVCHNQAGIIPGGISIVLGQNKV